LLLTGIGYHLAPAPVFAQDEAEQSASYLPQDTEFYATIDLSLSPEQEHQLYRIASSWLSNLELAGLLQDIENATGIDVEEDVLPWLGNEAAMGMRNLTAMAEEPPGEPEVIFFLATTDKDASLDFFLDKLMPVMAREGGELPTAEDLITYRGIDTLIGPPGSNVYCAFTEDYIVFCYSTSGGLFYETLDLYLDGGISLANTDNFQDALANLPPPWVTMFYLDMTTIKESIPEMIPIDGEEIPAELIIVWLPDYIVGSASLTDEGMICSIYYPIPEEITPPTTESTSLNSTSIVPEDAIAFLSVQNLDGGWEYIEAYLQRNWTEIAEALGLPPRTTYAQFMALINTALGFDLDDDLFGWMTGEFAFAMLPFTEIGGEPFPDFLILFEVDDISDVQGHLTNIINGLNVNLLSEDPLSVDEHEYAGVMGKSITNDAITDAGLSPGWVSLNVDGSCYLVLGLTEDALETAVNTSQGSIPSLDEAENFQGVLSMLPTEKVGMGYLSIEAMMEAMLSMIPPEEIPPEFEGFTPFIEFIEPMVAMGFSSSYIEETHAALMTFAIYCPLSPIYESGLFSGSDTLNTGEKMVDFSLIAPDVGTGVANISMPYTNVTDGSANIMMAKSPTSSDWDKFVLAVSNEGLELKDVAYVIEVEHHNLSAENMGPATITMKVCEEWVNSHGGPDNIKIFRIADDGICTILDTSSQGPIGGVYTFTAESPDGLSTFGLVATAPLAAAPVADFTASPRAGAAPLTVSFTDLSTNSPTSWEWDFNNDGTVDSTEQNPTYTYEAEGAYTVSLTVTYVEDSVVITDSITRGPYITVTAPAEEGAPLNWAAIGGGIAGGVVVIGLLVYLLLIRRGAA
jgi:PKD repeat protein